jgi:hypothetical protein
MPSTIRDLTELTTVASDDYLVISDTSDVTNRDKRISRLNLIGGSLTGGGVLATGGFTLTVPATGTAGLLGTAQSYSALKGFSAGLTLGAGTDVLAVYRQGTWSPVLTSSGTLPTVTYTQQLGQYTQIGNVVFYHLSVNVATISGGTGQYRFSLPSAPAGVAAMATVHTHLVDAPGTPLTMIFRPDVGFTFGRIFFVNDNAAEAGLSLPSAVVAGSIITVTGNYFV